MTLLLLLLVAMLWPLVTTGLLVAAQGASKLFCSDPNDDDGGLDYCPTSPVKLDEVWTISNCCLRYNPLPQSATNLSVPLTKLRLLDVHVVPWPTLSVTEVSNSFGSLAALHIDLDRCTITMNHSFVSLRSPDINITVHISHSVLNMTNSFVECWVRQEAVNLAVTNTTYITDKEIILADGILHAQVDFVNSTLIGTSNPFHFESPKAIFFRFVGCNISTTKSRKIVGFVNSLPAEHAAISRAGFRMSLCSLTMNDIDTAAVFSVTYIIGCEHCVFEILQSNLSLNTAAAASLVLANNFQLSVLNCSVSLRGLTAVTALFAGTNSTFRFEDVRGFLISNLCPWVNFGFLGENILVKDVQNVTCFMNRVEVTGNCLEPLGISSYSRVAAVTLNISDFSFRVYGPEGIRPLPALFSFALPWRDASLKVTDSLSFTLNTLIRTSTNDFANTTLLLDRNFFIAPAPTS
jgi:hypothetical protein